MSKFDRGLDSLTWEARSDECIGRDFDGGGLVACKLLCETPAVAVWLAMVLNAAADEKDEANADLATAS